MNYYLIIAICLIIFLIALFFITFVINKKTPVPPECQKLADSLKCENCSEVACALNRTKKAIEEEIKEHNDK